MSYIPDYLPPFQSELGQGSSAELNTAINQLISNTFQNMKYAEKIKHAELVAEDLTNRKTVEEITATLKNKGLYQTDIDNIVASARNIIGEKLKPLIRTKLLAKEPINNTGEFENLDPDTLQRMVKQEIQAIAVGEKRKVKELLKNGASHQEIYETIRQDFYPQENIAHQIATFEEIKDQNSGSNRMLNIFGGLGLMIVGVVISLATMQGSGGGRIFYGMVAVGFFIMLKGFITRENPY